jgi:hypothetical protein
MRTLEGFPEIAGFVVHVVLCAGVILVGYSIGVRFVTDGASTLGLVFVFVGFLWFSLARSSSPTERRFAASTAGLLLLIGASATALPAQYVIQGLNRARLWNDPALIRADLALGIDVRETLRWTVSHPYVGPVLEAAYRTFITQTFVPILCAYGGVLPLDMMRRYLWQFVISLWITILVFWIVPVAGPYVWWSYDLPMSVRSAMAAQLDLIRGDGPAVFRLVEMEGLVALPSFHTIGALAVTAACWRVRILGPVLVIVNALLIAATVMLGIHYAVDVLAGVVLYAGVALLLGPVRK